MQHAVQTAKGATQGPVVVVLGAHAPQLKKYVEDAQATKIFNPEWHGGMASSIRHGLSSLLQTAPEIDSAVFMVCDQPLATTELLITLQTKKLQTGKGIIASAYN